MTQLLLLGDSLVADYDWQQRMPSFTVHNFAVPGAITTDIFYSLGEVKQQLKDTDVIMIMVGTNDLLIGDFDFLHVLKKILVQLNTFYPLAEIIVGSLFPMDLPHLPYNTIPSLNSHIETISTRTGSCFLNIYSRFDTADKEIFQDDGIHITPVAYEIWTRSLLEHIAFLIESD